MPGKGTVPGSNQTAEATPEAIRLPVSYLSQISTFYKKAEKNQSPMSMKKRVAEVVTQALEALKDQWHP